MRAVLVGFGAVGRRVAEALARPPVESLVIVHPQPEQIRALVDGLGPSVELRQGRPTDIPRADVTVLAIPDGAREAAEVALGLGSHVVGALAEPAEARHLLALDGVAKAVERTVVVGATQSPGLSCVLAAFLAAQFQEVHEVHVASFGTGGPACARRHHAALGRLAEDWSDGQWHRRQGGSGRELVWFPDPVGGADCYRAGLIDPALLHAAFPASRRVTARMAATRRDRVTSWLPMLRSPHPEGLEGAVRVEVRGVRAGRLDTEIVGVVLPPAEAAGAVAATAALWAASGRLRRTGSAGLASLVDDPKAFLRDLAPAGVRVAAFRSGYIDS